MLQISIKFNTKFFFLVTVTIVTTLEMSNCCDKSVGITFALSKNAVKFETNLFSYRISGRIVAVSARLQNEVQQQIGQGYYPYNLVLIVHHN